MQLNSQDTKPGPGRRDSEGKNMQTHLVLLRLWENDVSQTSCARCRLKNIYFKIYYNKKQWYTKNTLQVIVSNLL